MGIEKIQDFFFWCMVVNTGIYALTAISVILFRDLICKIQKRIFGLDEETINNSTQKYLASYKLFITFFNFAPWIAILVIK
ncbi:DUF6868 family protein [Spirochaetota bacterium]